MSNTKSFKDLIVWQKARDLAVVIYTLTEQFPKSELYGLTSQMRRAAISISSNIAESYHRFHNKEKQQFLAMKRKSPFNPTFYFLFSRFFTIVVLLFSTFYFLDSNPAYAVGPAAVHLDADYIVSESELNVRIAASSETPVNAFDIELAYPREHLELVRASTANSIVSVWQYLPKDEQNGVIQLTGGMVEPFAGDDGEIIMLVFFVKKPGAAEFVFKKTEFAAADGKGTVISVPETSSRIVIAENGQISPPEFQAPPPRVEAAVFPHPSEKVALLSVKTEDDGAVKEVLVRSRQWLVWSEWQKTRLVAAVPRYAWALQVAVIGWDGERGETTVYRWDVAGMKALGVILVLAGVWYLLRRARKS